MAWKSKKKGYWYEHKSAQYWKNLFNVEIRSTPRSGAYYDFPGDLLVLGENILKDFVIEVKSEQHLLTKKLQRYYDKTKEDSQGKKCFMEIYANYDKNSPYILLSRKDFAKILFELDGYRKENQKK